MLLLRAAVGITLVIYGGASLVDGHNSFAMLAFGFLAAANGASLLVGFGTPVAAILASLEGAGIGFFWLPAPTPNVLATRLTGIFVVVIATAIFFLGPGALSFDARLFGRREIIIPPSSRPSKS